MREVVGKMRALAEVLLSLAEGRSSLPDLTSVVATPSGTCDLVQSVVDQLERKYGSIDDGIHAALELFESLYDAMHESSLRLLATLWCVAARIDGMHDVCNAIDLWIANNLTPRLRAYLLELADFQSDQTVKAHYTQLASLS
jgi:hypothetical protein